MANKSLIAAVFCLTLLGGGSFGGAEEIHQPLTWQECMAISARQNPQLLAALRSLEASQLTYKGSFDTILPQVALTNSFTNSDTLASLGKFSNSNHWSAGAYANLDVFNAQDYAAIRTDDAQRVQAAANARLVSATVRLSLYEAFINQLYYQQRLVLDKQILELQQSDADMVTLEYNSGQESKGDMLTSQANLYQAQITLSYDTQNVRAAQITLDQQLGDDSFELHAATGTLAIWSSTAMPNFPVMIAKNPQIAVSKAGVVLANAGLASSEVSLWPDLSVNGARFLNGPTEFPQNPHWSVGASLSLPIFGAGPATAYFQISSNKKTVAAAKETLRAAQESVRAALESDWQNMVQYKELVDVGVLSLAAAQLRNDESTIRYNTGEMPYETWIIAVQNLVTSEQTLLSAQQTAAMNEAVWENAQGLILGE